MVFRKNPRASAIWQMSWTKRGMRMKQTWNTKAVAFWKVFEKVTLRSPKQKSNRPTLPMIWLISG